MKLLSLLLIISLPYIADAQSSDKEARRAAVIKNLVDSKSFRFIPQNATPMNGRVVQLTADYDFTVKPDSVISYLPYYGRAYVAPMDPTQSPLQFLSKTFIYTAAPRKKDGWNISIKPKDCKEIQNILLTVSSNGYATVQVISTNREQISFYGSIVPIKVTGTVQK